MAAVVIIQKVPASRNGAITAHLLIVVPDEMSAGVVGSEEHKEEIKRLIEEKVAKKVEIEVRQMEEGRRFEDHFVDIENLINMEITVED